MSRSQSLLSTKGEKGEGGVASYRLGVGSLLEVDGDNLAPGATLGNAAAGAPPCNI